MKEEKKLKKRIMRLNDKFTEYINKQKYFEAKLCLMTMEIALDGYKGDRDLSKMVETIRIIKQSLIQQIKDIYEENRPNK